MADDRVRSTPASIFSVEVSALGHDNLNERLPSMHATPPTSARAKRQPLNPNHKPKPAEGSTPKMRSVHNCCSNLATATTVKKPVAKAITFGTKDKVTPKQNGGRKKDNCRFDRVRKSSKQPDAERSTPEFFSIGTKDKVTPKQNITPKQNGGRKKENCHSDRVRKSSKQWDAEQSTPEFFSIINLGTPHRNTPMKANQSASEEHGCSITVAVRVRPFTQKELKTEINMRTCVEMRGNEVRVANDVVSHSFACDHCFWSLDRSRPYSDNRNVYRTIGRPLLEKTFHGYNTCLFAYGQTGSGKSYSVLGSDEEAGIIPQFCKDIFKKIGEEPKHCKTCVEIGYFEIYNEKIHDLLTTPTDEEKKLPLRVREHPTLGPYIANLSTNVVSSFDDVQALLSRGNERRATAATLMNEKSSRSHSVFFIVLTQTKIEEVEGEIHEHTQTSKVNIVDLAGSERIGSYDIKNERFKEGVSINRSLLTLRKVISQLAENCNQQKKHVIPYRESVLTWLLKECLGGNSQTVMLATLSPSEHNVDESLSTMRYASQARTIVNKAIVNEDPKVNLIKALRDEIQKLKSQNSKLQCNNNEDKLKENEILKTKLRNLEERFAQEQKKWKEKLREASQKRVETNTPNHGVVSKCRRIQSETTIFKVVPTASNLLKEFADALLDESLDDSIHEERSFSLDIARMVKEANSISTKLGNKTRFQQCEQLDHSRLRIFIQMTHLERNVCETWSLEEFQIYLCQLREMEKTWGENSDATNSRETAKGVRTATFKMPKLLEADILALTSVSSESDDTSLDFSGDIDFLPESPADGLKPSTSAKCRCSPKKIGVLKCGKHRASTEKSVRFNLTSRINSNYPTSDSDESIDV